MGGVMDWRSVIAGLAPDVISGRDGAPYMERYHLRYESDFSVRVHHILASDSDRDLHDHPWDFSSLLLEGSYREVTDAGESIYSAGDVLLRRAEDAHRLILDVPVWTYVATGPVRRRWGFHTTAGWRYWRDYLDLPGADEPMWSPRRRRRNRYERYEDE